ncbi:MAG: DUF58 domain-containing protein [Oscillospiraceae bacterium]|nr:DUF58 domain-containing protein [Oscillospiraceae bacterium]
MEVIVILLIIAAAAIAESLVYRFFGLKGLSYTAALNKSEVMEGDTVVLTEELSNRKPLPLPFVKTEIIAPALLDFNTQAKTSKEQLCYIPSVFSLKGREKCTRVRNIKCMGRGVFELGATSLYGGDLFGFSGFTMLTGVSEQLTVLPTPLNARDFEPGSRLFFGDIIVRRFICEDPFFISGSHEYTGREPMNSIFWNGTARAGRLMALNRDFTTSARVLILLNFQRRDDIIAAAPDTVCEVLIKAAALALDEAVRIGAEFALVMNMPEEEAPVVNSGEGFRLKQLRRLAAVKPDCDRGAAEFIDGISLGGYTDIVLITPTLSQDTANKLKGLQSKGLGVFVYSPKNEAEAEFCTQITRAEAREGV